jgi:hypothetical protein
VYVEAVEFELRLDGVEKVGAALNPFP